MLQGNRRVNPYFTARPNPTLAKADVLSVARQALVEIVEVPMHQFALQIAPGGLGDRALSLQGRVLEDFALDEHESGRNPVCPKQAIGTLHELSIDVSEVHEERRIVRPGWVNPAHEVMLLSPRQQSEGIVGIPHDVVVNEQDVGGVFRLERSVDKLVAHRVYQAAVHAYLHVRPDAVSGERLLSLRVADDPLNRNLAGVARDTDSDLHSA